MIAGLGGFGAILWAAYCSISALNVVDLRSPFSSRLVMPGDAVEEKVIKGISKATKRAMCENMRRSYASALRNREAVIEKMGPGTLKGQKFLGVGLTLTTIASIITIMAVITSAA